MLIFMISMILIVCLRTRFVASHQVGYIWMPALSLFFVWIFLKKTIVIKSVYNLLWLIPLGVIAGNAQETFNIGISVALFIYAIKNFKVMGFAQWSLLISFYIGLLILVLSPGILLRVEDKSSNLLDAIIIWISSLRATYILFILLIILIKNRAIRKIYYENEFWINALLVSILFNLCIGIRGYRQLLGIELFASLILLNMINKKRLSVCVRTTVIAIFLFLTVCRIVHIDYELKHSDKLFTKIEQMYINSEKGNVYYDIMKEDMSFASLFNGEACYLLGGMFTETLGDFFNKKYGFEKKLEIYPKILETPEKIEKVNCGFKCAEGHWLYIIDKENRPKEICQKRTLDILGYEFPFVDKIVEQKNAIFDNGKIEIYEYYEGFDFIKNKKVEFLYK